MKDKFIIGLAGEMGSGKGTVASYLSKKYKASSYRFSDPLKDVARRTYLEENRENLQTLATILRQAFGDDLLSIILYNDVKNDNSDLVVIDGVRRKGDIEMFVNLPNFKLIYIETDLKIRYERIINRNEKTDDSTKSFERFLEDHQREADTQILELKDVADFVVNNNATLKDLEANIDSIIKKLEE